MIVITRFSINIRSLMLDIHLKIYYTTIGAHAKKGSLQIKDPYIDKELIQTRGPYRRASVIDRQEMYNMPLSKYT